MNPNHTQVHQNHLTPEAIKRVEKEVSYEEKTEGARVKHALHDLKQAGKAENSALKVIPFIVLLSILRLTYLNV